ncbi:hypothetical protein PVAND_012373 [Polypedilum vanderplanki]|nr:hypothetical protein PVAND_012373 [Polypedilum vanderplanki]
MGMTFYGLERSRHRNVYHSTAPFHSLVYYYLITPNSNYTNYEKILFPFDEPTWIFLCVFVVSTFGCIFILNQLPNRFREIVYGSGITMPIYNVLSIFFGISLTRLPHKFFSRFILILFIGFCLIFRTCYQSKMFEFITTDMQKPLPESYDDLYNSNYTILINPSEHIYGINELIGNGRKP